MSQITEMVLTVVTLVAGIALVSVLVSRNSQTPAVIQSAASGFSNSIATAISPVTGADATPHLGYPGGGFDFSHGFGS